MRQLANLITSSRFVFAGLMLLAEPLSPLFWVWYLAGGLSDLLDGPVARRLGQQSAAGAKLDSAADVAFIVCAAIAVFRGVALPSWVPMAAGAVALVRFAAYGVGFFKYRTWAAVHTWLNKATGLLLLLFPALFAALGVSLACAVLCAVGMLAAMEELLIIIGSGEFNRDQKSLFSPRKSQGQA